MPWVDGFVLPPIEIEVEICGSSLELLSVV